MEISKSQEPKISALACPKCGAPMYPDMKKGGFSCLYCDTFRPFAITDEDFAPAVKFRHQPVKIVDGLLKLGHVAIEVKEALAPPPREERLKRLLPLDRKLLERDAEAFYALRNESFCELNCPFCGNHLTSLLTENLFTCPYCGQKFGHQEQIATGKYDERLVVGRKYNLYSKCLPFKLSKPAAQISAKEIVKGLIQDTSHVNDRLTSAYVPVQLADLRWKMKVSCERGGFWYYQECLDWAWPRSIIYDIFLMDELSPWDYGEITSLKPAYLEGKVQLLASENLGDWQARIPDWILQRTAPQRLRRAFGLEEIQLRWVSRDIRQHNYGLVLLPIYALETTLANGGFLRLMMNGQTGKAALQITTAKEEFTRIIEPSAKPSLSPESTMLSPPIPIRYVKSPFLHERLTLSEALMPR
ncbi:hypothetical protein [Selenomonas sp. AB3002]|uniref:hypothetical protein n=1 Tax=Selenomonas sp. AB3002 TaxID=1392502 RepID=UPI0004953D1C